MIIFINNFKEATMKKTGIITTLLLLSFVSALFAAGGADNYKKGTALYSKGKYKQALSFYSMAIKQEPRNPAYYAAAAACYKKLGNQAAAQKYEGYVKALTRKPGSPGAGIAQKIKISAAAGFTTASMTGVNERINNYYANVTNSGGTGELHNIGAGFTVGLQAGYALINGLYVGPRFEFIGIIPAKSTFSVPLANSSGWIEYGGSLVDIMLGASYSLPLSGMPLSLRGDLYLGYGMAGLSSTTETTIFGNTTNIPAAYSGGTFAGVLCVAADYKMSQSFSAGLSLGFRLANVSSMQADKDVIVSGFTVIDKGDELLDANGDTMPVDFSGLIINLTATFAF